MRVNPILHWEYGHVWHFLRAFHLPYCSLYDQGYTSLGKNTQTSPNPILLSRRTNPRYWPAYMLSDWSLERAGRVKKEATQPSPLDAECATDINSSKEISSIQSNTPCIALLLIDDALLLDSMNDRLEMMQIISKALHSLNSSLHMVSIVRNDINSIAIELTRLADTYDMVMILGGFGPTQNADKEEMLDDVSVRAFAQAFGQELEINQEMVRYLRETSSLPSSPQREERMPHAVMLPRQVRLHFPTPSSATPVAKDWPVVQYGKVLILSGKSQVVARQVLLVMPHLSPGPAASPRLLWKMVVDMDANQVTSAIGPVMQTLAEEEMQIGWYPFVDHPDSKTVVTLQATNISTCSTTRESVEDVLEKLIQALSSRVILRVEKR